MTRNSIAVNNPAGASAALWKSAQVGGLLLTVLLLVGLVLYSGPSLDVLWNVTIPVLPAVFMVNPILWRNVCPLATLNGLGGYRVGSRTIGQKAPLYAGTLGIVLLFVMVPGRRFLFNTEGTALAVTIVAVALLAAVLGLLYSAKAGFCNSICPVLPVERLYGQRPLMEVPNARCAPCSLCTKRGCIDLSPGKSVAQTLGAARRGRGWLLSPFGLFAVSFPGFIVGYFTTVDGPLASAPDVYLHVFTWALGSAVLFSAIAMAWPHRNEALVLGIGALCVGLYYWYAVPTVVETVTLPAVAATPLRGVMILFVALWLLRAWKSLAQS